MGAALLVKASPAPGITGSVFLANSTSRPTATLYDPHHAPDQPQGLHVESDALLSSFTGLDTRAAQWLKEQDVDVRELDLVCVHQPSQPFVDAFRARMDIDPAQIIPTFPHGVCRRGDAAPPTRSSSPRPPSGPRRRRRPVRSREWSQRRGDAARW
ncbi:hypothetical protein ACFXPW_06880 [Streptomyces goshikiensis]|uniref:hypothetical protein n=1 Tax=Streptomyces goshikiensis TaxID=1942 RepID=UPI0036B5F9B6